MIRAGYNTITSCYELTNSQALNPNNHNKKKQEGNEVCEVPNDSAEVENLSSEKQPAPFSELMDKISEQVASCERSLFIFDEVQNLPLGLIDAIKPFIDYYTDIKGVNFSTYGTREILKFSLNWFGEGKIREDISLCDVEPLVQNIAFNKPGGYYMSELIDGSLVDYYVPFFPLERRHVELCAWDELKRLGYVNADIVKKVAVAEVYRPTGKPLFASKGCMNVHQKVIFLYC